MEQRSHQREVRQVDPAWTLSELMAHIAKALASDGPALTLAPIDAEYVNPRIALVVTTTGSSGLAKEVGLSAAGLLTSAKASNNYLGAEFGATWSLLLPLNHIAGINVLIRCLELGTIPTNLLEYEGKFPRADYTSIVPTQLYRALNGDENLLQHLQGANAVLVGGASLTPILREQAIAAEINVVETYGSTETSGGCIYNGEPLECVEVEIREDSRIAIKGAHLAHSYLNTDIELIDDNGWYLTSDSGEMRDGKVSIKGRIDDVVLTGGENVSLTQIEKVLSEEYPKLQIAAFAVSSPEWGQAIHIAIVGADSSIDSQIQEVLEERISPAAKGKSILHLQELPLIGIGKVDRNELARHIE